MSSPSPSEAPTLPVPSLGIKNASSEKVNKGHLPMDQQQSTLMQLPLKFRTIIWQYVLGGRRIEPRAIPFNTGKRIVPYVYKWRTTIRMEDDRCCDPWMPPPRCFACLLKTCRLVLWEAIDVLYGCNRFIFRTDSFWAASREIMPHQFARLRIMDFCETFSRNDRESWTQLCKAIAGMTNLHTLHMTLLNTSRNYDDNREKHWSDGLRHFSQKVFHSPKDSVPISEEFILDSLYQIMQVKEFEVALEDRWRGLAMPEVRSNAPFKLICEYSEDKIARRDREEQEQREEEAKKCRLREAQREADRLREKAQREADGLRKKAGEIVYSYQSFSG